MKKNVLIFSLLFSFVVLFVSGLGFINLVYAAKNYVITDVDPSTRLYKALIYLIQKNKLPSTSYAWTFYRYDRSTDTEYFTFSPTNYLTRGEAIKLWYDIIHNSIDSKTCTNVNGVRKCLDYIAPCKDKDVRFLDVPVNNEYCPYVREVNEIEFFNNNERYFNPYENLYYYDAFRWISVSAFNKRKNILEGYFQYLPEMNFYTNVNIDVARFGIFLWGRNIIDKNNYYLIPNYPITKGEFVRMLTESIDLNPEQYFCRNLGNYLECKVEFIKKYIGNDKGGIVNIDIIDKNILSGTVVNDFNYSYFTFISDKYLYSINYNIVIKPNIGNTLEYAYTYIEGKKYNFIDYCSFDANGNRYTVEEKNNPKYFAKRGCSINVSFNLRNIVIVAAFSGNNSTIDDNKGNNDPKKDDPKNDNTGSACNPNKLIPVLLVPGILGTSDQDNIIPYLSTKNITNYNYFIKFNNSNAIYGLHDPFREVGWTDLLLGLERLGYRIGCTMFTVPYDWRLSIDQISINYLEPWIEYAKKVSGMSKVNIIAHSMGGLVTRAYIQSNRYKNDINKFAMVGTPNHGSTLAYFLAEGGDPLIVDHITAILSDLSGNLLSKHLGLENMFQKISEYFYNLYNSKTITPSKVNLTADFDYYQKNYYYLAEMKRMYEGRIMSLRQLTPVYDFLIVVPRDQMWRFSEGFNLNNLYPKPLSCRPNEFLIQLNSSETINRMTNEFGSMDKVRTIIFASKGIKTPKNIVTIESFCGLGLYDDGIFYRYISVDEGDGTVLFESVKLPTTNNQGITVISDVNQTHTFLIKAYKDALINFVTNN